MIFDYLTIIGQYYLVNIYLNYIFLYAQNRIVKVEDVVLYDTYNEYTHNQ